MSISGARCLTRLTCIEIAKVWNTHCRITNAIAQAQIADLVALSPTSASSEDIEGAELDTADEIAIRDLLLGILYRAAGDYPLSRKHLEAVTAKENDVEGKWTGQVSKFELAVLELREVAPGGTRDRWRAALKAASTHLDQAASRSNAGVDLSSRLDSRIALVSLPRVDAPEFFLTVDSSVTRSRSRCKAWGSSSRGKSGTCTIYYAHTHESRILDDRKID